MLAVPLQPLAPTDQSLLADFLSLRADLQALASKHGRPLPDLIAWAASPHIAAYIHAYLGVTSVSEQLKSLDRKSATLSRIEALTTDDPAEERRIAQSILRALSTPRPQRHAARHQPLPPAHSAAPTAPPQPTSASAAATTARPQPQPTSSTPPTFAAPTSPAPRQPQHSPPAHPQPSNAPSPKFITAELNELLETLGPSVLSEPNHPAPLTPARKTPIARRIKSLVAAAGASG